LPAVDVNDPALAVPRPAISADAAFRAVFERAAVGMACVSFEDAAWLEVNDALCRLVGYSREELLCLSWPAITHPDDVDADLAPFRQMAAGALDGYTVEKRFMHKDGHPVWARLTLSLVRDAAGRPAYEVAVVEDIDQRRLAEAARSENARRFRAVLENVQAAGVMLDAAGRISFANDYLLRLTGWHEDEVIGCDWFERFIPAGVGREGRSLREHFLQSLAGGDVFPHFENEILTRDGERRLIAWDNTVLRDIEGAVIGTASIGRDVTSERQAQAQLRDREAHLRAIYEQTGAALAECDLQGRYTAVNQRYCELLCRSREELLQSTLAQTTFSDDLDRCEAEFERLVESGCSTALEKRLVRADGSPAWVAVSASRLDLPGGAQRVLMVAIDISARKVAEARLLASEARFRAAVQAASDIVWTNDAEGRMLGEQPGWAAFTGQSREEYQGYGWAEALHPDDAGPSVAAWEDAVAVGGRYVFEQRVRRHDGVFRTFSVRALPVRDERGAIREWVGVHTDITDLREADRALRDSEARYRNLFENMTEEVHFWSLVRDAAGRIVTWRLVDANPPALATWGRRLEDIRGRTADEIFGAGSTEHYRALVEQVMASGTAMSYEDYFPQLARHFRFTTIPLGDGFITTGADISGIKEAQAVIERQNAALLEADRRKDEFLATLAHELRNPLAPLRTALHIVERSDDPVLLTQARRIMNRQLGQMVRLIDDLLDVSRITTGKLQLNRERVPLQRVLQQAIETARPRIEARHHRLVVEPALREVWLDGDSVRLAQVFTNLLNNAAKYSENGATITVRVQPGVHGGERVRVSVIDTGIGIPPDALSRVFDLFTQIDHGADKAQGGLGIGLSLVQRLVLLHGGSIEATSAGIGKGSTFTVELPVEPHPAHAGAGGDSTPLVKGTPCTLVVADDNRDAADSLAIMLRLGGHTVHLAYDGASAVQAVLTHRPQVAIVDIGMPNGDGHDVARRLRALLGEHCPALLALSGWGQDVDKRASRAAGFDHHFTKPVDVAEIERLLASMHVEPA
jgi:PAS domain S-box-containing protein